LIWRDVFVGRKGEGSEWSIGAVDQHVFKIGRLPSTLALNREWVMQSRSTVPTLAFNKEWGMPSGRPPHSLGFNRERAPCVDRQLCWPV